MHLVKKPRPVLIEINGKEIGIASDVRIEHSATEPTRIKITIAQPGMTFLPPGYAIQFAETAGGEIVCLNGGPAEPASYRQRLLGPNRISHPAEGATRPAPPPPAGPSEAPNRP